MTLLDLLRKAADMKQLTPPVLAGYLGQLLAATEDSRTRAQDKMEELSRMMGGAGAGGALAGGGLAGIPGEL